MRNQGKYHKDWRDIIRPAALKKDNYKCVYCSIGHKVTGYYDYKKQFVICDEFMIKWAKENNFKVITIYLNVHHLDGNTQNNEMSNLRSCCPKCHFKQELALRKLKRILKKL